VNVQELDFVGAVATGAGMFGLWQPDAFAHVTDLATWEDDVAENAALERHIADGVFVPINIGSDGAFQFVIRGGRLNQLSERERLYRAVSSEPYLLRSKGSVEFGGLESVGPYRGSEPTVWGLDPGRYAVVVHLIDWMAEPGAAAPDDSPLDHALPDFIVEIAPESEATSYRMQLETFDRP
jgi:hypothetical protein